MNVIYLSNGAGVTIWTNFGESKYKISLKVLNQT